MRRFPHYSDVSFRIFKKLETPGQIQDFINTLPFNFEKNGDTMRSPKDVLAHKTAHCLEGALLSAAALWYNGHEPFLLDLETHPHDQSHVVAPFCHLGRRGAISKTNHSVLRYRDPVFKTPRELVMSYFNEYFIDSGEKTLRAYSEPISLLTIDDSWLTSRDPLWHIEKMLIKAKHIPIAPASILKKLRNADPIEITAGSLVERNM